MRITAAPASRSYARGASDAIARGGRYDEVGAIFGRNRPAVGFGLDVKDLAMLSRPPAAREPIHAPASRRRRACGPLFASCASAAKSSSPSSPGATAASSSPATASWSNRRPLDGRARADALPVPFPFTFFDLEAFQ